MEKTTAHREHDLAEVESDGEEQEKEDFDFDADIEINPQFLDAEWMDQARRYMKYSRAAAKANKRARQSEERVKTIRSELVNKPKQTDAGKNAATLEAYYRTNESYKKAKTTWIDSQFEADLLNGAVFAFQNRKSALENLVKLHGQEYFSTPSEPRDLPESAARFNELKQQSARSKIKERLRR